MKAFGLLMAASAALLTAGAVSVGVASAHPEPCAEDPQNCGFPPAITNTSVSANHSTHAKLGASINPGDQQTTYEVWISYAPCQGGAGECSKPVQEEELATATLPYKKTRNVKTTVHMLTPGCTYGYWFVATNGRGTVESEHQNFVAAGGEPNGPKECTR